MNKLIFVITTSLSLFAIYLILAELTSETPDVDILIMRLFEFAVCFVLSVGSVSIGKFKRE